MYVYIQIILLMVLPLIVFAQTEPPECSEGTCNNTVIWEIFQSKIIIRSQNLSEIKLF